MTSIIKVDTIQDQDGNNIINENANTITIGASGDTITIPAGATLANNGTATGFASIAWQSSIVTAATLSAVSGNGYWINTTSNACTITLPASASVGDTIIFVDYARTWGTNAVTIDQNSLNFQGYASPNPIYNTDGQSVTLTYSGATQGWIPTVDDAVTNEVPQPYSVDFLVVAGGGGGASLGGGGGAGGYRTSNQSVLVGTVITVTVGEGGAGSTGSYTTPAGFGSSGFNSSISGSGLTTITSAGGGGGGRHTQSGLTGGSGGGGGSNTTTGGIGNTPSTSPSQGNNGGNGVASGPNYGSGGGGGAGAVGATGTGSSGGNGGAGTASSITGSSVTRAGGGGGGTNTGGTAGTGSAGGGNGTTNNSTASSATANTGSGGGGGGYSTGSGLGGAGGKGVVILSMPLAKFSNTTTGSPTESDDGTTKVLIFNGTGSYTG